MNYQLALKLKEVGLEQIGDDGWYDRKKRFIPPPYKVSSRKIKAERLIAIPSLAQLVDEVEKFKITYITSFNGETYGVIQTAIKRGEKGISIIEQPDLATALAKLILELKGVKG